MMQQPEPLIDTTDELVWCHAHDVPVQACNGPHRNILTGPSDPLASGAIRLECLSPGQQPEGTPLPGQLESLQKLQELQARITGTELP